MHQLATLTASTMAQVQEHVTSHGYEVVALDEGQFYPDVVERAEALANQGVTVLVAGLVSNFLNHPDARAFQNLADLIPRAEQVTKLFAVCNTCNSDKAAFNWKKDPSLGNGTTDLIGGTDKYEAICRPCSRLKTATATLANTQRLQAAHKRKTNKDLRRRKTQEVPPKPTDGLNNKGTALEDRNPRKPLSSNQLKQLGAWSQGAQEHMERLAAQMLEGHY